MYGLLYLGGLGLLTVLSVVLGLLIGFRRSHCDSCNLDSSATASDDIMIDQQVEAERLKKWIAQMYALSSGMAAGVDQHSSELRTITEELQGLSANSGVSLEDELLRIVATTLHSNHKLQSQLEEATETLHSQTHELQLQLAESLTDPLTGIPNRRAFDKELARKIVSLQRHAHPFSLILLDVDHFKCFNDSHGHLAGDAVLKQVAKVLKESLRDIDHAARYGGEEFAAVLAQSNLEQAKLTAERIRTAIEKLAVNWQGETLTVTVSIGVMEADKSHDAAKLIERADRALYAAKQAGRNRAYYHAVSNCLPVLLGASPQSASTKVEAPAVPNATPKPAVVPQPNSPYPERAAFTQELQRRMAEWHRYARNVSIMLVAVDQFAAIKNQFGEQIASQAQQTVPRFLAAAVRESDLITRLDEATYGVVLPGTGLQDAAVIGERVRGAISLFKKIRVGDDPLDLTVTVAATQATNNRGTADMQRQAEEALALAQNLSGNATFVHDGRLAQPAGELFELTIA